MSESPSTASLVPGRGRTRGLAHIGVIQWLTENSYTRLIARFIDGFQPQRADTARRHGLLDVAFLSMQPVQDSIARLRLSRYAPDVSIDISRNACGFFEFRCAEELIELGRERTQTAFAPFAP